MPEAETCGIGDCERPICDILVFTNPNMPELPICSGHLIRYMKDTGQL